MAKRFAVPLAALLLFASVILVSSPANVFAQAKTPKDVYILKGNPMGGVRFDHKKHSEVIAQKKCDTCHHPSKPEKPLAAPQQACQDCHTKVATPPMKTNTSAAFHKSPMAQGGLCIDCHKAEKAKGKPTPATCMDCHKKENV
jgi:hypothetical protein